ncbi:glucosaminidase domain-containing protein [Chryseolinea lacunae]|uniref:Glucosaminidase domain-containing protein n=1 Tax=Chryseolinea lacunae TaxID=2801331 RepID=A0ABS1KYI7_9BACT|nr:glucosaminidase domain-containing protein [Chryseolinea lacunae]MBL0744268.1 glucosaminidase domain-containing protein [Chryseolinea lacunae]
MACRCGGYGLKIATVVLLMLGMGCNRHKGTVVDSQTISIKSLDEVEMLKDELVKPVLYTNVSGFDRLPSPQAKAKFIAAVLPSILIAKHNIEEDRKRMVQLKKKLAWEADDSVFFFDMKVRYKAKTVNDLIGRMRTLPNSIVLAQTAVESGWGQSRFFLSASNLFGIWSFNANEPRIAASHTRGNRMIYLRSYTDMSQSIQHYFEILSRSTAYRSLRRARLKTDNPFKLLPHLKYFSERRSAYTRQLRSVIVANNLTQYDRYRIDPEFLIEE